MLIAAVAMATVLGWAPGDGPADIVARLGSPRFAEREAAAESLKRLGQQALPELRKARSAADPEVRLRASQVRDEIESVMLLEPTMVRLDFRDRPLSEVVEAIGRRAGVFVSSDPAPGSSGGDRIDPRGPSGGSRWRPPSPCRSGKRSIGSAESGGLRRFYPRDPFGIDEPFDQLLLMPGEASPPKSDAGPFRVELIGIRRERDLDLAPGLSRSAAFRSTAGRIPGSSAQAPDPKSRMSAPQASSPSCSSPPNRG